MLTKGRERFAFYYHDGQEALVLAAVLELAEQPDSPLDWFDAAVLGFQVGRCSSRSLEDTVVA